MNCCKQGRLFFFMRLEKFSFLSEERTGLTLAPALWETACGHSALPSLSSVYQLQDSKEVWESQTCVLLCY